jgi:integrase
MALEINKLSSLKVKALTEPGRYGDGGGLYLVVSKKGAKAWVFRYRCRRTSKLRDQGLGALRDTDLAHARRLASKSRMLLRDGIDPIDQRSDAARQAKESKKAVESFGECARIFISTNESGWKNHKHRMQWKSTLDIYASALMQSPVDGIETSDILGALSPIWASKTETASRVRQRIEAVLDWAIALDLRAGPNPARWRGHLDKILPKPAKLRTVRHRPAALPSDAPKIMEELASAPGLAACALRLQILVAGRPGEVAAARWEEFDLENRTWTIPGERMKAGKAHRVPLSREALALIGELNKKGEYLFPGGAANAFISTASPLKTLKSVRPNLSSHGFRSTFRDWAAESTSAPREVVEQALAHRLKDKTEAAYFRSDVFDLRAELMQKWASHLIPPIC